MNSKSSGGGSLFSLARSPRKSAIEDFEVPRGAVGVDRSKLESLRGPLRKESRKGRWQKRYFRTVNHYLVYYSSSKMIKVKSFFDLCDVTSVSIIGRFGHMQIKMLVKNADVGIEETTVSLQAENVEEAQKWVSNIGERCALFGGRIVDEGEGHHHWNLLKSTVKRGLHHVDVRIEGPVMQRTKSRFKPWKSRFLRLVGDEVRFYKSEPICAEDFNKYVAIVNLIKVSSVSVSSELEDGQKISLPNDNDETPKALFVIHTTTNTKDIVLKARASGSGLAFKPAHIMCRMWVSELNSARTKVIEQTLGHLDSHIENKEKSDRHASNPYVVQQYDINPDAAKRARNHAARFQELFDGVNPSEASIEAIVSKLNEVLQELSDVAEVCSALDPTRSDVFRDHVDTYHSLIEKMVASCVQVDEGNTGRGHGENRVGAKIRGIREAHEALRILDFLKGYSELLGSHLDGFTGLRGFGNAEGKDSLTDLLSEVYVEMAKHDFMAMCRRISAFIMDSPKDAVHDGGSGHLFSSGPADLLNMIHEFVYESAKSGFDFLQAQVFVMCSEGVTAYLHELELRVAQIRHLLTIDFDDINVGEHKHVKEKGNPNTLLFLCVLVNDAELLVEAFDALEDEFADLIENHKHVFSGLTLEEHISKTIHECQSLGQLALLQIQRVIFDDFNPMMGHLMTSRFSALESMILTMQDYFKDFKVHIRPIPFMKLLGYCYDCTLKIYVAHIVEAQTQTAQRASAKSVGGERVALSQEDIDATMSDVCAVLKKNLRRIHTFFVEIAATTDILRGPDRAFRSQLHLVDFIEDVIYRLPISKVHEAFANMIKSYAAQSECFPHIMVLFSRLTLFRNYKQEASQWQQNLGVQSKRRLERFPHSRENILKKCFAELAGDPYLMDVESLLGSLRSADRKLNSYLKRLPKREEIRKMHKSGEILLKGDAAEASLEIVRFFKAQNIVTSVGLRGDNYELQLLADAVLAGVIKARSSGRRRSLLGGLFSQRASTTKESNGTKQNVTLMSMFRSPNSKKTSREAALARARAAANPLTFSAEAPAAPGAVGAAQAMSPEQNRALEQGLKLLDMGAIRQDEYDELERSIMSAHARLSQEEEEELRARTEAKGDCSESHSSESNLGLQNSLTFTYVNIEASNEDEERLWLRTAIEENLMAFGQLSEAMQHAIVNAFEKVRVSGTVINQGDQGDCMFVVASGEYDVIVDGRRVNTLHAGALFGELAMLFNAPRNASIVCGRHQAGGMGTVWRISRFSFHQAINESKDQLEDETEIIERLAEQFRTDNRFRRKTPSKSTGKDESSRRSAPTLAEQVLETQRSEMTSVPDSKSGVEVDSMMETLRRGDGSLNGKNMEPSKSQVAQEQLTYQEAETLVGRSPSVAAPSSPVFSVERDWDDWLEAQQQRLDLQLKGAKIDRATYDRRLKLVERRWAENC